MPDLDSGTYKANNDKKVTYWPAPDKDGTGDELWEYRYDSQGRSLGREKKKDAQGNPVRSYPPPEGFVDQRSFDGSENYVKTNPDGSVFRNANGEAVNIKPGQAIVEHADGNIEVLEDEYARVMFAQSHEQVNSDPEPRSQANTDSESDSRDTESDESPSVIEEKKDQGFANLKTTTARGGVKK